MKLKRWHLYLIATLLFIGSFVALNFKYDRFYRVNGINNDNRALIEMYLNDTDQEYLIDHAIAVDKFIDYITIPNFKLQNYQYYNSLKKIKTYTDNNLVISEGNSVANKLEVAFGNNAYNRFETLVKNDLVDGYLNTEDFDFDNIEYYQLMRTIYDDSDYSYISATNTYTTLLQQQDNNYTYKQILEIYKDVVNCYNSQSLNTLFTTQLPDGVNRIYNVSIFDQVINNQTYISSYEPKHLAMIEGIDRVSYSMYLQIDAYNALKNMYQAMKDQIDERFIISRSYIDYDVLTLNEINELAGYSEYQLGTTVNIKKKGISDGDFASTSMYQWLIENSYQYGFILRYPSDKQATTNHEYDATRFRYVGVDTATTMHNSNLSLEEYLNTNQ